MTILYRPPLAARSAHGDEPWRNWGFPFWPWLVRNSDVIGVKHDEAGAETEVGLEVEHRRQQRAGQLGRPLPHPRRKEGPGPGLTHHCPGKVIFS